MSREVQAEAEAPVAPGAYEDPGQRTRFNGMFDGLQLASHLVRPFDCKWCDQAVLRLYVRRPRSRLAMSRSG